MLTSKPFKDEQDIDRLIYLVFVKNLEICEGGISVPLRDNSPPLSPRIPS